MGATVKPCPEIAFSPRLPAVLAPVAAGAASQRVALPALRSFSAASEPRLDGSEGGSAAEGLFGRVTNTLFRFTA